MTIRRKVGLYQQQSMSKSNGIGDFWEDCTHHKSISPPRQHLHWQNLSIQLFWSSGAF